MGAELENRELQEELSENLQKISQEYNEVMLKLIDNKNLQSNSIFDKYKIMSEPLNKMLASIVSKPHKMFEYQLDYYQKYNSIINNIVDRFSGNKEVKPLFEAGKKDARFKDETWNENFYFDFIKQTYLMTNKWFEQIVDEQDELEVSDSKRAKFVIKQYIDAMSPSNFVFTNPAVLKKTFETKGENLIQGLKNLKTDIDNNKITTTKKGEFKLGENLGITEGNIVYQNEIMQLIHYKPLNDKCFEIPLLIMPPWINKYYILDMKPQNSFVKYMLEQGFDVYLISWINPDKSHNNIDFEDYLKFGPLAAIDFLDKTQNKKQLNIIGYCLGGTLLSCLLAYLKAKNIDKVKSATFFTSMLDFSEAGDLSLFIDENQLKLMEKKIEEEGIFSGTQMSETFSILRANELVWSFIINNYLLGQEPFPFDLLEWNQDSTNLPGKMHIYYLKNMYLLNNLIVPNKLKMLGVDIDLSNIQQDCYFLSCIEDHIAPWVTIYKARKVLKNAKIKFVLADSGHIAGVVNPPYKNKYYYLTNDNNNLEAEEWKNSATKITGSWWNDWVEWNKKYSGSLIDAKTVNDKQIIEKAPGSYVLKKL